MDTIRVFFSLITALFLIIKKDYRRPLPLPLSCAPVRVTEYASIFLNIFKYLRKSLNKMF